MHLDCSRQFYTIDQIKRLLIYMSLFKLNRFHWHLTDNEAWRLELKSFPNLAKNSSFRGYNQIIPPFYGTGYKKSGGYYSKDDVKNLIQFAKKLNIEFMPEIDLPAHSWALIKIMPELYDKSSNMESIDLIAGVVIFNLIVLFNSGIKYFLLEPIVRSTNFLPRNFSTANSPKNPFFHLFSSLYNK